MTECEKKLCLNASFHHRNMNDGMVCVLVFVHVYMYKPQIKNTYISLRKQAYSNILKILQPKRIFFFR